MRLYASTTSPFARKVIIALHETGLLDQTDVQSVTVSPLAPGDIVPTANPLGKIPCLIRDDGKPLYDSRVITKYLDSLSASVTLYPNDESIWDVATLEATIDGIMEAAVSMAYETRVRPAEKQFDGWLDAQWLKIDRALTHIEGKWTDTLDANPFMDLILAAALEYIDMRHDDRGWRSKHAALATRHMGIKDTPSLVATRPQQ